MFSLPDTHSSSYPDPVPWNTIEGKSPLDTNVMSQIKLCLEIVVTQI